MRGDPALLSKVTKSAGTSPPKQRSSGSGGAPRDQSPLKRAMPGNLSVGQKMSLTVPPTVPKSRVLLSGGSRLQQSKAASKGQTGTNLKTAWTKEERHSESEMVAQPAPEPVPEPPAASSLSVSCGCSSWDSRFNGLRIPSEPRELGSVEAAVNDVVQPSTTCNESTIPVVQDLRASKSVVPCGDTDDSEPAAWTNSLGGKLDDLCERTLALEKELRAQCWEVLMEARLQSIEEDLHQPTSCHTNRDDVMSELLSHSESTLIPKATDSAVERELNSLRNSVGELKTMVQQIGGQLRNFSEHRRSEDSSPPPHKREGSSPAPRKFNDSSSPLPASRKNNSSPAPSLRRTVEPAALTMVKLSTLAVVEPSSMCYQPCLIRVCSQPLLAVEQHVMPAIGSTSLGKAPPMNTAILSRVPVANGVRTSSPPPSLRAASAISPPRLRANAYLQVW